MTKKNDEQALQWMRGVCLVLPNTSEGVHYGELVFKVGKKLFASCGDKRGPRTIVFQVNPKRTEALLARDPRFQRYPYEKRALWIKASDVDDWDEMRDCVEESYRLIASSSSPGAKQAAPKKVAKKKATKRSAT